MNSTLIQLLIQGIPETLYVPREVNISKKKTIIVEEDEGITPTTAEGLAGLRPVKRTGCSHTAHRPIC
jgi:hypothetical protein